MNLPDDELFKYLEITKKALSGKIDNNLLELSFPLDENYENEKQQLLMMLNKSGLKEDALLRIFYDSIIKNYDCSGNYLILLFHDVYDVMIKTSDNRKLDESEEVYEYIICAICPVSLSKPGLGYFETEKKIKSRIRDWIVEMPQIGFTYPGFIDRSSDVGTIMYYTKNAKDPHYELIENSLGCMPKHTASIQKEVFQSIVESSVTLDEEISEDVYTEIQENLNTMIEEHNEIYEDTDAEPITLTKDHVKTILLDSGISEEVSAKIEATYEEAFGEEPPLAENILDSKIIKANAQKKKEKELMVQIEALETKLNEAKKDIGDSNVVSDTLEENEEINTNTIHTQDMAHDSNHSQNYDVVLHVKPEKIERITTEMINGQKCIVVPIDDDEQATINGIEDLL